MVSGPRLRTDGINMVEVASLKSVLGDILVKFSIRFSCPRITAGGAYCDGMVALLIKLIIMTKKILKNSHTAIPARAEVAVWRNLTENKIDKLSQNAT